jgi:hypothetical protein
MTAYELVDEINMAHLYEDWGQYAKLKTRFFTLLRETPQLAAIAQKMADEAGLPSF